MQAWLEQNKDALSGRGSFLVLPGNGTAEAFHFQVTFFPDNEGRDYKNENVHDGSVSGSYLAHCQTYGGIKGCKKIANGHSFLKGYSSIYHLVINVSAVGDEQGPVVKQSPDQ